MRGLLDNKKIMFRYRGTGKFAVARKRRQDEAIARNEGYQKMISSKTGINEYIANTKDIGNKQLAKLKSILNENTKNGKRR
tara:strand:- start:175 stop:417 length:243 start_codon:yes stop_codon:yes gene_type:complete